MGVHAFVTDEMVADARAMAGETLRHFTPGYYNNTHNSHFRGKIGELACAQRAERAQAFPANRFSGMPTRCRKRTCIW